MLRSMQHASSDVHFRTFEEMRKWADNFITMKNETFFASEMGLPERRLELIDKVEAYSNN